MRRSIVLGITTGVICGCAVESSAPRGTEASSLRAMAHAQVAAAVQGRRSRGFEDEILRMEARVPGLGGVFYDAAAKKAVVYLANTAQSGEALTALRDMAPGLNVDEGFRSKFGVPATTTVLKGSFAFSDLVAWQLAIAANARAVGIVGVDADESSNRVRVMISSRDGEAAVSLLASKLGIPDSAVAIEVTSRTGGFATESPRDCRRLQLVRGWSHGDQTATVFS